MATNKHRSLRFSALLFAACTLSACSTIDRIDKDITTQNENINNAKQGTSQLFKATGLVRTNRPLIVDPNQKAPPPPEATHPLLNKPIKFSSMGSQTIAEMMQTIARLAETKIDFQEVLQDGTQDNKPTDSSKSLLSTRLAYTYEGTLRGLLDDLTSKINASWRLDTHSSSIQLFRFEHRVLGLMLPPGDKSITASISLSGGGGGGGSVSVNSNTKIDPWQSTLSGISVLLGAPSQGASSESTSKIEGQHGYVIANQDLAQVIVVARPQAMNRIADYVQQINRRFARNVLIDVRVLEFQSSDGAQAGVRADAVMEKVFRSGPLRNLNIEVDGAPLTSVSSGSPSTITIGAESSSSNRLTLDNVIQALDSVSKVTLKNQGQIVAINGQPAPFQQANQITYLASTSTTIGEGTGTLTVTRTPGSLTVGFTANFVPTVLSDNRILLQYQIQSSSLLGLKTIGGADNSIQLPEVFSQSLQQHAYLNDGDVIALFSFDQDRSQVADSTGVLSKSRSATQNNIQTAVLIQVRVAK